MSKYLSSQKSALFSVDDDDVDDDTFLNKGRNGNDNQLHDAMVNQRQQLVAKSKEIEEQSVQSSQRALRMLKESEDIGIATADELYIQREQLEKTDRRLDDISTTLKYSQNHIRGIKSVFGGIKNFLSKSKAEPLVSPGGSSMKSAEPISDQAPRRELHEVINKAKNSDTGYDHPALRIRNIEDPSKPKQRETDSQTILDRNLDEMVDSLSRLKGLALGLGEEIDSQNGIVENIITKSEKVDMSIQRQNKEMNRLLKK